MTTATIAATAVSPGRARATGRPTSLTPGGAQAVFRATLDVLARPGTVKRLPSAKDEPLAGHVPAALLPLLALADLSTPACVVATPTEWAQAADSQATSGANAWDEIVRVATNAPRAALADARLVAALRPLTPNEFSSLRVGTAAAPENGALACLAVAGIAIVDGANPELDAWADDAPPVTSREVADAAKSADATPKADATPRTDATAGANGADASDTHQGGTRATAGRSHSDGRRLLLRLSGPGVPGTRAVIVTGLPAGFAAARHGLVAGFPAGADLLLIAPDGAITGLPRTTSVEERAI